jgi:uncharacterized protein YbjT (DUF2867 family)
MILVTGGSGRLGSALVPLLAGRSIPVRVLSRDPGRAAKRLGSSVEIIAGDLRDPAVLKRAVVGIRTVVSAATGFGPGGAGPAAIDEAGNRSLVGAARDAGVEHFVLVSIVNAGPGHPTELYRAKHRAEVELKGSGLEWTIVRPTVLAETWVDLLSASIRDSGKARIFGRGENPVNFVSAVDVARVIELAVVDPALWGAAVDVGGPEDLTMRQAVVVLQEVLERPGPVAHVPLAVLRLAAAAIAIVRPDIARLLRAAVAMDTADMRFSPAESAPGASPVALTSFAEVARRELVGHSGSGGNGESSSAWRAEQPTKLDRVGRDLR